MATPDEISTGIIEPMCNLFGEPKRNDPTGFFDLIVEVLEPFNAKAFPGAVRSIAIKHKFNSWPSIAEIRKAVETAPMAAGSRQSLPRFEKFDAQRQSEERRHQDHKTIIAKMRGVMGLDAAENGWALGLYQFIQDEGDLPFPQDEQRIKGEATKLYHQQQAVLRGEYINPDGEVLPLKGPVKAVQDMAQAMVNREASIAAEVRATTHKEAV